MDASLETLVVVCDRHGAPLGYDLRAANENEREGVYKLATAHPGTIMFADARHRGREYHDTLQLINVDLVVPDKHKLGQRPPGEIAKARIRLVIESVFSTPKRQMRMEAHLAGDAKATVSIGSGTMADAMRSIDSSTKLSAASEPGEEAMFASPVSLVVMHGSFTLLDAPIPPGTAAPAGNVLDLVIDEHTGDVIGRALPSPAQLATSVPLANTTPVN